MEAMHKPNPAQPAPLETPRQQAEREYELQRIQQGSYEQARAMERQQRYDYERQAQERARQQQRSPYDPMPYPQPGGMDMEQIRRLMSGRGRHSGPAPQAYEGKITKQMYIKIV